MEALFDLDVRVKPEHDIRVASVCFITDAGNCSGEKFSNDETPGNGGNGNPGGIPDYDTPQEQCQAAGYGVTSCPAGSHGDNPCPADSAYYQKCVCDANITETCTKPYYGVGASCDGKYASCKRDDAKACKEDGYSQTAQCSSVQTPNKKCSYNSSYYDKCVCRSDLVSCTYPQTGVGEACGGKYASCQCPSSYKSCECGGAAGATSCTVNGVTTYSDCKECCKTSCPSGYTNSTIPNGYVQDGEACNHCSLGLRYKIKPNPCSGYQKCQFGPESGAKTCLSGSTTMYDKCRPCSNACPSGTSESNPGGCGGSTTNECGTKTCYYPYEECCSDSCSSGSRWVNCGAYETKTPVGKTECGNTCYECRNKYGTWQHDVIASVSECCAFEVYNGGIAKGYATSWNCDDYCVIDGVKHYTGTSRCISTGHFRTLEECLADDNCHPHDPYSYGTGSCRID
ncbi:MAG: hypothetical protein Q4F75_01360 [Pseudomonadota bacterium]|nr:hypothetical protein [Pseudomonadota bacterium]